jgi:hypothetical protein
MELFNQPPEDKPFELVLAVRGPDGKPTGRKIVCEGKDAKELHKGYMRNKSKQKKKEKKDD